MKVVNLVVEDRLSEAVLKRIMNDFNPDCAIASEDRDGGCRGQFDAKFCANSRSYSHKISAQKCPGSRRRIPLSIAQSGFKLYPGTSFGLQGNGYIKKRIHAFQQAARYTPYIVLTDLDDNPCPPQLIHSWLGAAIVEPKFLFRIAVREIETWLLADKPNITSYLVLLCHKYANLSA